MEILNSQQPRCKQRGIRLATLRSANTSKMCWYVTLAAFVKYPEMFISLKHGYFPHYPRESKTTSAAPESLSPFYRLHHIHSRNSPQRNSRCRQTGNHRNNRRLKNDRIGNSHKLQSIRHCSVHKHRTNIT